MIQVQGVGDAQVAEAAEKTEGFSGKAGRGKCGQGGERGLDVRGGLCGSSPFSTLSDYCLVMLEDGISTLLMHAHLSC